MKNNVKIKWKCENVEKKRTIMIHEHLKGKQQSRWGSSTNDVVNKRKERKKNQSNK